MFATAALLLIGEIIAATSSGVGFPPVLIAVIVAEVGIFIGLAFWTKTKPYSAIITGLILFILMWIATIFINEDGGQSIYRGIVVKALIIYFLVSAIKPAKAWQDLKKTV